jgi:hypothetical protein
MNARNEQGVLVRPTALRQFGGHPADNFCLVADSSLIGEFSLPAAGTDDNTYQQSMIVPINSGDDLGLMLARDIPAAADVLIICRRNFLSSPDDQTVGRRRIVVMPCASTPVTLSHIRYFLRVAERTDPAAQAARAEEFFGVVQESAKLRVMDGEQSSVCEFDPLGGDYVWNQQAGPLGPGEQQIAPAGELSVLPMDIADFDEDRRLALNGTITLAGTPIVHAGYDEKLAKPQAHLYEQLLPLYRNPVQLDIRDGLIVECRDVAGSNEGAALVATFTELFTADPRYRMIWELGFGINTDMDVVPANCGLNEPYGAAGGVVHVGLGLTPHTEFALTFLCLTSSLVNDSGRLLAGKAETAQGTGRIRRVRRAGCGCH